jgi:hypothetical protein
VQEEIAQPQAIRPGGDVVKDFAEVAETSVSEGKKKASPTTAEFKAESALKEENDKLVDAPTPATFATSDSKDFPATRLTRILTAGNNPQSTETTPTRTEPEIKGLGVNGIEEEMKTVAI